MAVSAPTHRVDIVLGHMQLRGLRTKIVAVHVCSAEMFQVQVPDENAMVQRARSQDARVSRVETHLANI